MDTLGNNANEFLGFISTNALMHALVGVIILIVGLYIVKFASSAVETLLGKFDFLSSANLIKPITSLVRAILTVFILIAVLQHFGLTDVLAPLKSMVELFVNAIPRIIGAGVVGYAGWVIARLIAELAEAGLDRIDQQIAERANNSEIKIAKLGKALIFALILLPIAVAALGVLDIPTISEPASGMINKLMAAIPNIIGAGIILLVTYLVTKFVVFVLAGLLEGMQVNALPQRLGISGLFSDTFTPVKLIGGIIMFFAMLAATIAAINTLGITLLTVVFANLLEFGGGLLIGALILIVGNFLGNLAYAKLSESSGAGFANIVRFAIFGLVLAMGLKAMGIADDIINLAFGFTIGGVAVATALAFGLGGRDAAKSIADGWATKITGK